MIFIVIDVPVSEEVFDCQSFKQVNARPLSSIQPGLVIQVSTKQW